MAEAKRGRRAQCLRRSRFAIYEISRSAYVYFGRSTCKLSAVERCIQAYERYLCEARALATATIVHYIPFIRTFLTDRFGKGPVALSRLAAVDVVHFVQRQAPRLHRKVAKTMTTALRSFLRYARYRGDLTLDLAA